MEIKIAHYISTGKSKERLQLNVQSSTNLQEFKLFDNYGNTISFENLILESGDKVIIYIGEGNSYIISSDDEDDFSENIFVTFWNLNRKWDVSKTTLNLSNKHENKYYTLQSILYKKTNPKHHHITKP